MQVTLAAPTNTCQQLHATLAARALSLGSSAETGASVPPTLKQFEEEIQRYKGMEKAMKALPVTKCVGWTKIDAKPLKKALEILVSKWSYLYIKYLQARTLCFPACEWLLADVAQRARHTSLL